MSIYKRGKTWTAHAKWTDSKGKKHQETKGGFHTKKEATKYERELLGRVDSGRHVGASGYNYGEYMVGKWLPARKQQRCLKRSTEETYKMLINAYILPSLGYMRLENIKTRDIEGFFAHLQQGGRKKSRKDGDTTLSNKSVRNIGSIVKTSLKDAVRWELISFNPADSAVQPPSGTAEIDVLTPDMLRAYVASIQEHRFGSMLQLVALNGLRRGEVLGLSWKNVNFPESTISINRTRIRAGNATIFDTPKSKKSIRTIDIDPCTMALLRKWKLAQVQERLLIADRWNDEEDLVVTNADGKPPTFSSFDRMFRKTLEVAGMKKVRFHSLRHSFIIAALRSGGDIKVVSEHVGHSDIAITQRIYNHVVAGDDKKMVNDTAAFILGVPKKFPESLEERLG